MRIIPVTPERNATFTIVLPTTDNDERQFRLTFIYNSRVQLWTVDLIYDTKPLLLGVALVGGKVLFNGYGLEFFPQSTITLDLTGAAEDAIFQTLGTQILYVQLDIVDREQLQAVVDSIEPTLVHLQ